MNATMNITVRVIAAQALAESKAINAQLRQMQGTMGVGGTKAASSFGSALGLVNLSKFGKDLQWTGRQLEYNFTIPILLAGAAATKWALDIEDSMVRVRKVYGDAEGLAKSIQALNPGMDLTTATRQAEKQLEAETKALGKSFELLSARFGVHQAEVIDIAASWAQAGSAGVGLANSTRLTMEAMILGELDAAKATEGLIAIQSVYKLQTDAAAESTYDLHQALADINAIENATSVAFGGLIDVVARAGGSARTAGIDIRHLSAMAAALVPAAGSASQAGNGLRTMISRIMAPTKEATELLGLMGVNVFETSWQAKNGVERIEALAESFDKLTQSQKVTVSAAIASRWQINRFDVLMADITSKTGQYARALEVTADPTRTLGTYTRELTTYLRSQPQAFKMLTVQLQNAMAKAIVPMLPAIIAIIARITQLVDSFTKLDPAIQQLILGALAFLAVVGPIAKIVGSFILMFASLGRAVWFVIKPLAALVGSLLSVKVLIVGAVIAAVAALVYVFRDELAPVVDFVRQQFYKLPQSIQDVFIRVVQIVSRAALAVYEWLSYLNPFARHSPSLVDQVRAGVTTILSEYSRLNGVADIIRGAIRAHEDFQVATAGGRQQYKTAEFKEKRAQIVSVAPGAGPAVDRMIASVLRLESALQLMVPIISEQGRVTAVWEAKLKDADDALDDAKDSLDALETSLKAVDDQLDAAQADLDRLANTGIAGFAALEQKIFDNETAQARLNLELLRMKDAIPGFQELEASIEAAKRQIAGISAELDYANDQLKRFTGANIIGMGAMNDAIFENEMAQKRLRLEMLRMEEAGQAVDDVKAKLAALQGEIETLKGEKTMLRLAGAGSDVLGPIQTQIDAIEQARRDLAAQGSPFTEMENQMKDLQRAGEILDLEKSIQFDPLLRQIEKMTDMTEEMSFDQIIAGIAEWQPQVAALTTEYNSQNTALAQQQAHLAQLQAQYDAMSAPLEARIAALQREAEELNLISRVDFQPLQRQLEQLMNPVKEMSFEDLYASIQKQIGIVAGLQTQHDAAAAAVDRQKAAVDALTQSRNAIADSYDVENDKLSALSSAYSDIEGQIRDLESALNDMAAAGAAANAAKKGKELSNAEQMFLAGGGADFEVPGGMGGLGREGGLPEIEEFNKQLEDELAKAMDQLSGIDIFGPIKGAWNKVWGDIKDTISPTLSPIANRVKEFFSNLDPGDAGNIFDKASDRIKDSGFFKMFGDIGKLGKRVGPALKPVGKFVQMVVEKIIEFGGMLVEEFKNWGEIGEPLIRALQRLSALVAPILAAILIIIEAGFELLMMRVKPIFDMIIGVVRAALQIIRGIIMVLLAAINGDWSDLWSGLVTILDGIWDAIYTVVSNGVEYLFAPIRFVIDRIVGAFQWLYDTLVGHSIVPDLVNAIIDLFKMLANVAAAIWNAIAASIKWVWENVIKPVWEAMRTVWNTVLKPTLDTMLAVFKTIWNAIGTAIKWVWDSVIKVAFNAFISFWNGPLQSALNVMKTVFGTVFDAIGGTVRRVWDGIKAIFKAMAGLYDTYLKGPFDRMKSAFGSIFDGIGNAVKKGINFAIDVINTLIDGINAVDKILPGSFHINHIHKMAMGGTIQSGNPNRAGAYLASGGRIPVDGRIPSTDVYVRSGFATNMPRAIVGEGSPLHPEYVIPTDPAYRANAARLYSDLGARLGLAGIPGHEAGGIVRRPGTGGPFDGIDDFVRGAGNVAGSVAGGIKDAAGYVAGVARKGAVTAAFAPFLKLADAGIGLIPGSMGWVREMVNAVKNKVYDWVKGEDGKLPDKSTAGGEPGHWQTMWNTLKSQFPTAKLFSAFRAGAITATGNKSLHSQGRAIDVSPRMDIFNWIRDNYPNTYELIYSPAGNRQRRKGANHMYSEPTRGDHWDHVHWGMRMGGLIPMRDGGIVSSPTAIMAGEAGPEAILPLTTFLNPMLEKFDAIIAGIYDGNLSSTTHHIASYRQAEDHWLTDKADAAARQDAQFAFFEAQFEPVVSWLDSNPVNETLLTGFSDLTAAITQQAEQAAENAGIVTPAKIAALFEQYGVDPREGAQAGETADARFARIADDINSGTRTMERVLKSIDYLANNTVAIPALADGAYIKARPGGVLARLGEGGRDEIVAPVSHEAASLSGGSTYNFYGDLSMPNIRSGKDAKTFLENLEALVG